MAGTATAIAIFSVDPGSADEVLQWQSDLDQAASRQPGYVITHFTRGFDAHDDWAAAVTFTSERHLNEWLDSDERAEVIAEGERLGVRTHSTIRLLPGERPPAGMAVLLHTIAAENRAEFIRVEGELHRAAQGFAHYLGGLLLVPSEASGSWISVVRFADDASLDVWLQSRERAALLRSLRVTLEGDFEQVTRRTPFGSIVRVVDGQVRSTANWRTAMVVFMVLFPTVMLLSRYLSPVLSDIGLDPGLSLWLSNIVSVVLLTWVLMPTATRVFGFWLDPIEGRAIRPTVLGISIIVLIYAVTLVVFMTVKDLQFWDFDR
ncbi:MAG: hypothetical protein PHU75_05695 [Candidatus Nanopelagicales bacterium]|nr:hypothetical protein [Candidatus Nanopelagicales bacterium]